jgi:hypothetical protein
MIESENFNWEQVIGKYFVNILSALKEMVLLFWDSLTFNFEYNIHLSIHKILKINSLISVSNDLKKNWF